MGKVNKNSNELSQGWKILIMLIIVFVREYYLIIEEEFGLLNFSWKFLQDVVVSLTCNYTA